ncbi:hypothetical protein OPQ81_008033 [Rhizoctonia solani]|nr:hypothetical protein OPQ81_008033 [Rhizoctonia solani]
MSKLNQYLSDDERGFTIVYAGWPVDREELETWSTNFAKTDETYKQCLEKCQSMAAWGGFEGYVAAKKIDKYIGRNYIAAPGHGHCDLSCETHVYIFYRRRTRVCGLERFRNWTTYQESEKDLAIKRTLEAMGIPLRPWSKVPQSARAKEQGRDTRRVEGPDREANTSEHKRTNERDRRRASELDQPARTRFTSDLRAGGERAGQLVYKRVPK